MAEEKIVWSLSETMKKTGFCKPTIMRAIKEGSLKTVKLNTANTKYSHYKFLKSSVEEWLRSLEN